MDRAGDIAARHYRVETGPNAVRNAWAERRAWPFSSPKRHPAGDRARLV
jgi:hypothetical protein